MKAKIKITVELSPEVHGLLECLTKPEFGPETVKGVIERLIDHAQQGVYRPGAWEREWLAQAFSDQFTEYLEPGCPYGREGCEGIFQRPKGLEGPKDEDKTPP